MIEKDDSIVKLIERLKSKIDFTAIEFVPYWDADLCAIGLKQRNHLIFLLTIILSYLSFSVILSWN